ncbi:mirror-image polydactyly gene 1 protein-like [Acanthaster planci]|uniref:Mirror-image polydactyly gene 1 protein-like n=1 Tax=Acanthaster planci TaxID=133434 RepID=A0A8B7Y5K7_ACAPL|nr:mirror-image polydactyly gene 1 protein-like [Acanthaster planci]
MAEIERRFLGSGRSRQRSPYCDPYGGGDEERMLMEDMHHTVSQTKDKIGSLRQALAEKNQVIRRERALRKAAERRELDKSTEASFIDMYAGSNPSVNEELKDWLSPAKQRDRILRDGKPHPKERDLQEKAESAKRSPSENKGVDQTDAATRDDLSVTSDEGMRMDESEDGRERQGRRFRKPRRRTRDDYYLDSRPDWNPNFTMPPAHGTWYPPVMGHYSVPPNPWVSPHRVMVPPDQAGQWHSVGPSYGQFAHSEPNLASGPPPLVRRHSDVGQAAPKLMETSTPETRNTSKEIEDKSKLSPGATANQLGPQVTSTPIRVVVDRGTSAKMDFEEGVPMLLSELGSTRDVNKELQERLLETEQEIESMRLSQSLTEATLEARVAARAAAVVEEIYAAQKERDEAIMARLRVANEERDESIARLRRLENKDDFDSGTDVDDDYGPSDMSMGDLLARLSTSDTGPEIAMYGKSILGQINRVKTSKGRIVAEEMRTIIQEKDAALAKCKKLEREAIELRRTAGGLAALNNSEQSQRTQLDATRQERDAALAKARKIQEELDEVKIYYSLHKSLSQEVELRDQFNNTISDMTEQVKVSDQVLAQTKLSNSQLAAQVKQLQNERSAMAAQLHQALQAQRDAQAKLKEKERLIAVLRKKVAEGTVKTVN